MLKHLLLSLIFSVTAIFSLPQGGPFLTKNDYYGNSGESDATTIGWLDNGTMQITWGNGQSDLIFLTPKVSLVGATQYSCTFSGRFGTELAAEAYIAGCPNATETVLLISTSQHVKQYVVSNGITIEASKINLKDRSKRFAYYDDNNPSGDEGSTTDYFDYDYEEETNGVDSLDTNEEPPVLAASISGPPPGEITVTLSLGYDQSFLKFRGSEGDAYNYMNQAIELARTHFRHKSLSSKVNLRIQPNVQKLNFRTKSEWLCDANNQDLQQLIKGREGNDIPLIIFSEDCAKDGQKRHRTGCAFTGAGCGTTNGKNLAIVDLTYCGKTSWLLVQTVNTLVHEIGHLLGMAHDFEPRHLSRGCEFKGFMSYGKNLPEKWSSCSDSDFVAWFNRKGYSCPTVDYGMRSCGASKSDSCSSCGNHPDSCKGECVWDYEGSQCIVKSAGFTIKEGYGWHNADDKIESLKEVEDIDSIKDCENACTNTINCVGFTYIPRISRCDLKSDEMAVLLDQEEGIVSATLKLRPGTGWHNSEGSVSSISEVTAELASQCEGPCRDTYGCIGWTYVKGKKRCDLKSLDDAVSYSFQYADVVSGLI